VNEILHFKKVEEPSGHTRSPALLAMISVLLRPDPKDRPTTGEILSSKFINTSSIYTDFSTVPVLPKSKTKMTRVVSVDDNLNNFANQDHSMDLTVAGPLRIVSTVNPHPNKKKPLFKFNWENIFWQLSVTGLLFAQLGLCLKSCPATPSDIHIYPIILLSVTSLLIRDYKHLIHYQYLIAILQWLWTLGCAHFGTLCSGIASQDVVPLSTALCLLSLTVFFLSTKLNG